MRDQSVDRETAPMFQVIKAVLWSMIGVRGQKGYEDDVKKITPKQAIIAGIIGAVIFVLIVLTFVNLAINYLG
jgi:Protein of unknown function (DUF2970)